MGIALTTPTEPELAEVVAVLREWQDGEGPLQLHPGDLGWAWQYGPEKLAAGLRIWRRDRGILAIGLIDSPEVLRLTVAPDRFHDAAFADQVVADVADPERGVLPAGAVAVETPNGSAVQERFTAAGWDLGEPWTPLQRDLAGPVEDSGLRVEVVGAATVADVVAVHRSAFGSDRFTPELWHAMAAGLPYAAGRSLLGRDTDGHAVAEATVWSAGPGRPGLLEPVGVHEDFRGHGYGRAVCLAAAAALRELGSTSAQVCTQSARVGAVATYESAGFVRHPERLDRSRPNPDSAN